MKLTANLAVHITKQGNRYVAYAPALDISTSGKTENEAKKRFGELVPLFFEELDAAGTTNDVLTELGWKKRSDGKAEKPQWMPPVHKSAQVAVRMPVAA